MSVPFGMNVSNHLIKGMFESMLLLFVASYTKLANSFLIISWTISYTNDLNILFAWCTNVDVLYV